jgi:hypothetical protein
MTITGLLSAAFIAGRRSSFHMIKEFLLVFKIIPLQVFSVFGAIGIFLSMGIGRCLLYRLVFG